MKFWQRLLRVLGYTPLPRLSFRADQEMIQSLRELAESERRRAGEVAADLLGQALAQRQRQGAYLERWEALSGREQQVTALICLGYTNRQIAARLGVSPDTVKIYVRNVLRKFGLVSRAELRQALAEWDFGDWPG
jgi:DNA-binding CsgD family transcriptional regulator